MAWSRDTMGRLLVFVLLTVTVLLLVQSVDGRRRRQSDRLSKPFINDPECPRRPDLALKRKCLKKCHVDSDCKSRNKACRCDGDCGWSCVKPNRKCKPLKNIPNGHYELQTEATFGHQVRYWCDEGYVLHGDEYRKCQGDEYWSGQTPYCQFVSCPDPDDIAHGSFKVEAHNTIGAKVQYFCNDGLQIRGQSVRVCGKDGRWSGMPPFCVKDDSCREPPEIPNAKHNGITGQRLYPLGVQLVYECHPGYRVDGFFKAICVPDGKWMGPKMTCEPQRCSHPGDIPHATREGYSFVYPKKVTYKCHKGYQMEGNEYRMCQQNGEWSGEMPKCTPVRCPDLGTIRNGYKTGLSVTYGSEVHFFCHQGFRLVGSQYRTCMEDATWSGSDASCTVVDCGQPGPFPNGKIEYVSGRTTFGSSIHYLCFTNTKFEGDGNSATCQADGNWSRPLPYCWSKCKVPRIDNGTVVSEIGGISHGVVLQYTCDVGFRIPHGISPLCFNGSFTANPVCEPESCSSRPQAIRDGLVRFYTSHHGDQAHYTCDTGFQAHGSVIVTCLYGNWTGVPPVCEPQYCNYPGTIENGQILLVGVIGKYEYRPYVKKIGHNDQIEYHCNKTYKRIGPVGATCVAGEWSPPEKPMCVPGHHPKLQYLYRGKRSTDTQDCERGLCQVPHINNAKILHRSPGQFIQDGDSFKVKCFHGYSLSPNKKRAFCNDGELTVTHKCVRNR